VSLHTSGPQGGSAELAGGGEPNTFQHSVAAASLPYLSPFHRGHTHTRRAPRTHPTLLSSTAQRSGVNPSDKKHGQKQFEGMMAKEV
jgi:hypothetical protein